MEHTKEQKDKYFRELRTRWQESKALAETDQKAKALWREAPKGVSYYSFFFTLCSMRTLQLDGLPYVDCKTFRGWRDSGFTVRKGEHSKIDGMTWVHPTKKDEQGEEIEDKDYAYPKVYNLFHRSQVEAM